MRFGSSGYKSLYGVTKIQCVPLATEPGISLIILTPMKILQRNLNRGTFILWEMKRNVSVVCVCRAPDCCDPEQRSASQPGSVASGTLYILRFQMKIYFVKNITKVNEHEWQSATSVRYVLMHTSGLLYRSILCSEIRNFLADRRPLIQIWSYYMQAVSTTLLLHLLCLMVVCENYNILRYLV
jgi:hypothetical protein